MTPARRDRDAPGPDIRRIGRTIVALVSVGLVALVLAGGFGVWTLLQSEQQTRLVQHTRDVEGVIAQIGIQAERSEAARRGYLIHRDAKFKTTWAESRTALVGKLGELDRLLSDNPVQLERARTLRRRLDQLHAIERATVAQVDRGTAGVARMMFRTDPSAEILREIRRERAIMAAAEARLLDMRGADRRTAMHTLYWLLALSAVLIVAIIGACIAVIRRYTRELAVSRDALRRMNVDLESAVRARTAELHRANEEIQRFAYIVSHDLRSPLVNVMGFTAELESARQPLVRMVSTLNEKAPDLVSREARLAIEEDLPEAVRFIRTSTQKMDRLINAILKLSREGRRTLAPEPLAMTQVVQTVADALRHRTDQLGAKITVEDIPDIVSDRVSIEQIFSNLLENAVKYLKPGRPGEIRVSGEHRAGGGLLYEVVDNGRGVDPRDHQRIFELFRRSGQQDQPGEGIGLAHVRSLIWRLGGTIEVQSELDGGATFRLSLPSTLTGDEGE